MSTFLPNFFIVGAPKSGTTSLYYYLQKNPQVFMSPVKEPNYFCYQDTIEQGLYHKEKGVGDWQAYQNLFRNANGSHKAIGEASVSYLFYPQVPARIKKVVPEARIIISLRNPVDRAISHYFMEYKLGYVDVPLADIVFQRTQHRRAKLWYQQYVELGLYYDQVKRYLDTFGRDRVKIFVYEELVRDIRQSILELFHFLDLDPVGVPDVDRKYNTYSMPRNKLFRMMYGQKALRRLGRVLLPEPLIERVKAIFLSSKKQLPIEPAVREYLEGLYLPEIKKLETLLHKDLSVWYGK